MLGVSPAERYFHGEWTCVRPRQECLRPFLNRKVR
jgi:hypothetical protein